MLNIAEETMSCAIQLSILEGWITILKLSIMMSLSKPSRTMLNAMRKKLYDQEFWHCKVSNTMTIISASLSMKHYLRPEPRRLSTSEIHALCQKRCRRTDCDIQGSNWPEVRIYTAFQGNSKRIYNGNIGPLEFLWCRAIFIEQNDHRILHSTYKGQQTLKNQKVCIALLNRTSTVSSIEDLHAISAKNILLALTTRSPESNVSQIINTKKACWRLFIYSMVHSEGS